MELGQLVFQGQKPASRFDHCHRAGGNLKLNSLKYKSLLLDSITIIEQVDTLHNSLKDWNLLLDSIIITEQVETLR